MSVPSDALASFVPELLARSLAGRTAPPKSWTSTPCELAVLGVDISESTSISEDLFRWSLDGSESVARALNTTFSALADLIIEHHGLVTALAGDEIMAVWPTAEMGGLDRSAYWAARAAAEIQAKADSFGPVGGYPIRLRMGIGAGRAWLLDIGREHGRRIFIPVGPAIQGMARAQKSVGATEIGLSDNARFLLGMPVGAGGRLPPGYPLLRGQPGGGPPASASHDPMPVPLAPIARYIPDWVFDRLRSGIDEIPAELAPITAMFVQFRARNWDEDVTRVICEATLATLDILNTYDGTLVDACQDLDGVTLVAGFGLPPVVREREATRANLAALEISRAMQAYVEHGIGVATGHVFCGVCGSAAYRQYAMVGPVVNLAARLMQHAQNEVLCDQLSHRLSRDRLRFSARGRMDVKGFANAVDVYRPEWHETDPGLPTLRRLAAESSNSVTRGREREREQLAGHLVALSLGTSTAVIVTGEPGVGKSHLALDLLQASEGYGRITVLVGACDDVDPRPYHAWRRVFAKLLRLSTVRDSSKRAELIEKRLAKWPELGPWAPLLNDALDVSLDDTTLRDMTGRARRENTIHMLVQLLTDVAGNTPLLIVLDDCQWMDSSSWELVRAVYRSRLPVMIVLLTRPPQDQTHGPRGIGGTTKRSSGPDDGVVHTGADVQAYLLENGARALSLKPLPPDVTEQIAQDSLGVDALDEPLRELFRGKVDGSPLFAIELAFQLREDEVIAVAGTAGGTQARLAVSPAQLSRIRLPVRVEEVFRARLSALSERQRAVIRAASVVGTSFDEERVLVAGAILDARSLADDLHDLERGKIIKHGPEGWQFTHALVRDAVLQSLLPSELRQRHRDLAEWHEANDPGPETYAILARRWAAAGAPARQLEYLEAAATSALTKGAAEEATALIETAIELEKSPDVSIPRVGNSRRAFWHSQLGEALAGVNRLEESVAQFGVALGLLGQRLPKTRAGWTARLAWEALKQLLHLAPRGASAPFRPRDTRVLSQAAWIFSRLAESYYFRGEVISWITTNLISVNLAESARDAGLAGRAYSGLANLVGTIRLHSLAARYFRRSRLKILGEPTGTESRRTLDALPDLANEHDLTATVSEAVYLRTMGRRHDVTSMLDEVIRRFRASGLNHVLEIGLAVRGCFHEATGALRSARADLEELLASARRRGNADHIIWGTTLLGPILMSLGRTDEAITLDQEATRLFREKDKLSATNFLGSHMQALVAQRRTEEALSYARKALDSVGMMPIWFDFVGLTAMARACIEMLEQERGSNLEKEARWVTRRALHALRGYVRVYPFCKPRYDLYLGMYQVATGKDGAAHHRWSRALRSADRSGLRLDGARMRLLLAYRLPEGAPERAEHLSMARQTLDEIGLRRLEGFERTSSGGNGGLG